MSGTIIAVAVVSAGVGAVIAWLVANARSSSRLQLTSGDAQRAAAERDAAQRERTRIEAELAAARTRRDEASAARIAAETRFTEAQKQIEEMRQFVESARTQLEGSYELLSKQALDGAITRLLDVVKPHLDGTKGEIVGSLDAKKSEIDAMLGPVREMLTQYRSELQATEEKRSRNYGEIELQIKQLLEATEATRREASKVADALGNPKVGGTWGETALERCLELAGMTKDRDYKTQETFRNKDDDAIRPDVIVFLPGDKVIPIDSKAPTAAYLEARSEPDEKRQQELLVQHARSVKRHIDQLSSKEYHDNVGRSVDFTVLFLGGDQLLYAALGADPSLFEYAASQRVFLATPLILLPLLRAVVASWRAERSEENAKKSLELAQELYDRFTKVFSDIDGVGKALEQAAKKYNAAIGSIDSRLVPQARKLQELVASSKDLPELDSIEGEIRESGKLPAIPAVQLRDIEGEA